MPWKETCTMEERYAFIEAWLSREFSVTELCRRFGVARKTGYKWINRFKADGMTGLADHSRARHTQDHRTPEEVVAQILALKTRHPRWGPVTLHSYLIRNSPGGTWPAPSTIGNILDVHGLVRKRRPRQKTPPHTQPLAHALQPNDVWSADYKGQFQLGNGEWCYPLTLTDNYSRLLITCQAMRAPDLKRSQRAYQRAFRRYGLPRAIRTDNGWPFAYNALGGLSPLSIWLIRLGVYPERIASGKPQQNGRHERMHRTLKAYTASPPAANLRAQQGAFDRFLEEYNEIKPHQGLGLGVCPGDVHQPSGRPYPEKLPEMNYPDHYLVRTVRPAGHIRVLGAEIYATRQLRGEIVGLEPLDHDQWQLYFGKLKLGVVDQRLGRVIRPT